MDASRLLEVVNDIESEVSAGIFDLLAALIQQYTAARDTPTQDNTPAIQTAFHALTEYVTKDVFAEYPPSKAAVLEAIGGQKQVGPGLKDRLDDILSVAGQTTAGIVTSLGELQTDLQKFHKACGQTKAGLQALHVAPHSLPADTFEAGILIPERIVDRQLGELAKELEVWNTIIRGFQEITGDAEREVTISGLGSGSYEAFLAIGAQVANLLAKTISKVLEWYGQILELRKARLKLAELGAPVAETEAVEKHEHDQLEENILKLATELVKEVQPKVDPHRANELETHITVSIRRIARFVDKGGTVEVTAPPPAKPTEPPARPEGAEVAPESIKESERYAELKLKFDYVSRIREAGSSLRRLPERPEPILQLTDGEPDDESPQPERPSKKKG